MKNGGQTKRNDHAKDLMEFLLVTGGISLILAHPVFLVPAILIARHGTKKIDRKKFSRAIYYLKERRYISVKQTKREISVQLTKTGQNKALLYSIQSSLRAKFKESQNWDGRWRLVIFDIPVEKRVKRDGLRITLRRSGFEQLQKSTWIYPFDCEKEIEECKKFFKIQDSECRVVLALDIGNDKKLKKLFGIPSS